MLCFCLSDFVCNYIFFPLESKLPFKRKKRKLMNYKAITIEPWPNVNIWKPCYNDKPNRTIWVILVNLDLVVNETTQKMVYVVIILKYSSEFCGLYLMEWPKSVANYFIIYCTFGIKKPRKSFSLFIPSRFFLVVFPGLF